MTLACSTKDKPGGDACCLERGHAGPHDWQGGRPASQRDARDVFGRPLQVGDKVATLLPRYRYKLAVGVVTKITPKMLRVRLVHRSDGEETEHTVDDAQVCKGPAE